MCVCVLVFLSKKVTWKESAKEISNGKTSEDILRLSFKRQLKRQTKVVAKGNDTEREGKKKNPSNNHELSG